MRSSNEDRVCQEADGCPTEGAVLKRFWRSRTRPVTWWEYPLALVVVGIAANLIGAWVSASRAEILVLGLLLWQPVSIRGLRST